MCRHCCPSVLIAFDAFDRRRVIESERNPVVMASRSPVQLRRDNSQRSSTFFPRTSRHSNLKIHADVVWGQFFHLPASHILQNNIGGCAKIPTILLCSPVPAHSQIPYTIRNSIRLGAKLALKTIIDARERWPRITSTGCSDFVAKKRRHNHENQYFFGDKIQ